MITIHEVHVAAIKFEDSEEVASLIIALLKELSGSDTLSISGAVTDVKAILHDRPGRAGFIAKVNNESIGVLMLEECRTVYAHGVFGEVTELYVEPRFRERGVAKLLMDRSVALATERGWTRLEVGA